MTALGIMVIVVGGVCLFGSLLFGGDDPDEPLNKGDAISIALFTFGWLLSALGGWLIP